MFRLTDRDRRVLQEVGYAGAMSIEHEDPLYGADNNHGPDFSAEFKVGGPGNTTTALAFISCGSRWRRCGI